MIEEMKGELEKSESRAAQLEAANRSVTHDLFSTGWACNYITSGK